MVYAVYGFVWGLLIPYMARRFAKFMPATFAYALYRLFTPGKMVSKKRRDDNAQYIKLMHRYVMRSIGWGIVASALTYLTFVAINGVNLWWWLFFVWSLLLLAEIDERMFLLPDILTIPLLLVGFLFSAWGIGFVSAPLSAMGAFGGYFLPVVVSLLFVWKNKDAFGGGDVKLLSAIGAWLGLEKLLYVIVLSSIIFVIMAMIKRQRTGAYGPSIAAAAIIVALYFF